MQQDIEPVGEASDHVAPDLGQAHANAPHCGLVEEGDLACAIWEDRVVVAECDLVVREEDRPSHGSVARVVRAGAPAGVSGIEGHVVHHVPDQHLPHDKMDHVGGERGPAALLQIRPSRLLVPTLVIIVAPSPVGAAAGEKCRAFLTITFCAPWYV